MSESATCQGYLVFTYPDKETTVTTTGAMLMEPVHLGDNEDQTIYFGNVSLR